jgi:hypothetical protein
MRNSLLLTALTLSACASPGGPYPSLQPRAAEATDPRVPVVRPLNDRPATPGLIARLSALVDQARSDSSPFDSAASQAERLAAGAGPPQSETWIAAQEALTAAIAARKATADALSEIDEIAATALQTQRGIAPNDFAAIQRAGAEVGALDQHQAERIKAIQRRLAL